MKAPDAHLHRADPVMASLIDDFGGPLGSPPAPTLGLESSARGGRSLAEPDGRGRPEQRYAALVRSITGQQLSVKAAALDLGPAAERFGGHTPTPEQILADDPEELRLGVRVLARQGQHLRSLAEHVLAGEIEVDRLDDLSDGEVIRELIAVKGIGEWTAHMFLMFTLHRPDVLPTGDLGVAQRSPCARTDSTAPPPPGRPRGAGRAVAPRIRTTRPGLYLWRSLDNEPV